MFGILTTLQSGRGAHLVPVSCPIVLTPIKQQSGFGRIEPGHADYRAYRTLVDRALTSPLRCWCPASKLSSCFLGNLPTYSALNQRPENDMTAILDINAREILDSRGNPTV